MNYIIEEIYEISCDTDKILTVVFRLEGDGEDYYRKLVDSDYYNWCNEHYISEGENFYELDIYDDEEYMPDYFNYDKWNMYYSNEDMVIDYIMDNYPSLKSLPSAQID